VILVLTGVAGSGKSTVGRVLARELAWPFYDGDDHHPPENVRKMRSGIPLDETDRGPWLDALRALVEKLLADRRDAVVAASLLRQSHRDRLALPGVRFVYLKGDASLIAQRLRDRKGHFFDPALLDSQFAALEEPGDAIAVDITATPQEIAGAIRARLFGRKPAAGSRKPA
jgi:gluconokinase